MLEQPGRGSIELDKARRCSICDTVASGTAATGMRPETVSDAIKLLISTGPTFGKYRVNSPMTSKTAAPREPRTDIPARRISAFIYGNILVLAALVVLWPDGPKATRGIVYVLGMGFSTFIAHVASDVFAHLLRHPDGKGLSAKLPRDLRDAVPIATSAILPTVILAAAWLEWLEAELAWRIAIGVTLVRLSLLGPIAAWIAREPLSPWPLFAGVLLALLIAVIALLKAVLTH